MSLKLQKQHVSSNAGRSRLSKNWPNRTDPMRLFIAIELSEALKTALGKLRSDIPGARWVPPEQIHLTLAFLGELDEETTDRLTLELAGIQAAGFELSLSGTGCFPNVRYPRVLWVGVKPQPLLTLLADKVNSAVTACNIPLEERPFSPHITLARFKAPAAREVAAFLGQHRKVQFEPFSVTEFTLFQSKLTSHGALHAPVRNFPLATSASAS
jgi:2'-5' RNA ligase